MHDRRTHAQGESMRHLLLPLSRLYGLGMACRNKAFDLGLLKSVDVGVPVISVGNMTMGGTGKTPLVEYIVGACLEKGRHVAVVSRGYKRASKGVVTVSDGNRILTDATLGGDEPVQIARKYPRAIVVVGERRVQAARTAVTGLKADVVIMDDGFQHRSLRRTLDIVVLDSRKDLFLTPMVPAGERREPVSAIKRADVVAMSRADQDTGWWRAKAEIAGIPAVHYRYRLDRVMELHPDGERTAAALEDKKMFLFSGIGDHQGFVCQARETCRHIVGDMRFPDHHSYSPRDLSAIVEKAKDEHASALLTTEKDAVRLSGSPVGLKGILRQIPLFYVGIAVDITQGRDMLYTMIDKCLAQVGA